jgi:hypothetical protein
MERRNCGNCKACGEQCDFCKNGNSWVSKDGHQRDCATCLHLGEIDRCHQCMFFDLYSLWEYKTEV